MAETTTISRPELTMPEAEAEVLRAAYRDASVVLEYGSGGSTVLAGEMPGKQVFSVESDRAWAQMMRDWFAAQPPVSGSRVDVIWSDIGPTKEWGHPKNDADWRRFAEYPLKVWELPEFLHPDVVLVDGRFRIGCALATCFLATRPVTLLFDDYVDRKHYHKVEDYLGQPRITGRLARFDVTPKPIPPMRLLRIMKWMMQP